MKITATLLDAGKSIRGGWNRKQMDILGVSWPPREGWQRSVIGKDISGDDAERYLALRGTVKRDSNRRSPVKNLLPFPRGFPAKDETVIASFDRYLSKVDREILRAAMPVLSYMLKSAAKRTNQANQ